MKKTLFGIVSLIIFLLIPFAINRPKDTYTVGPELSELSYQETRFTNGDLNLAGMMFLPENQGPYPMAVFIHGSGTSRRDNAWYLTVVKHLVDNGIGVFLPDKRGSENSEGDWRGVSLPELAQDTLAAIKMIQNQSEIPISQIGIIGFSQGGWIAPVVANQTDAISFVVSFSGSGTTTDRQLEFEEINNIQRMGTYRFVAKMIASITVPKIRERKSWRNLAGFDPIPYWKKVETPVFFAFGENDTNLPVGESVERLKNLEKENFEMKVYPNGGHGITEVVSSTARRIQPEFLDDLTRFVKTNSNAGYWSDQGNIL